MNSAMTSLNNAMAPALRDQLAPEGGLIQRARANPAVFADADPVLSHQHR